MFLVFSCWLPHVASAQVVNVPDPNLAAALRETLGLALNAPITRQAMQSIINCNVSNHRITNLTGLEHATRLEGLDLRLNQIRNLNPLVRLTRLQGLILQDNRVRDVRSLAGLTQLVILNLRTNQIRDVSPLAKLVNLEKLMLAGNLIMNTSPLVSLKKLAAVDEVRIYNKALSEDEIVDAYTGADNF